MNGEERQNATIEDLIFSVPFLIQTISEGITIRPGDVIATGTPAGVGIGNKPPVFLKSGDTIEVSITGLGTLKNKISEQSATNLTISRVSKETSIPISNLAKTSGGVGLTTVNFKQLYYQQKGASGPPIIFIHGLGGSSEFFTPLIDTLGLKTSHSLHLLDLEGHGLSPTSATSSISISSYASDFQALAQQKNITGATIIAHSMGCFIALTLALNQPDLISNLILIGPPPNGLPEAGQKGSIARAAIVRDSGMAAIVDAVSDASTSENTKLNNPLATAAIRLSLLGQDPEGYAKGCTALAGVANALPVAGIRARTLIVTGDEDKVSPPTVCEKYAEDIKGAKVVVLPKVGHWHLFEDLASAAKAIKSFLL